MISKTDIQTVLDALQGVLDRKEGEPAQLWSVSGGVYEAVACKDAIAILQAALAEPQSKPVAIAHVGGMDHGPFEIVPTAYGVDTLKSRDKLYTHPASKSSLSDIRGAVARGWCTKRNAYKTMDVELAEDIADAVWERMK
jgi:hypothetical protein